jgi:hypothetical protein
MTEARSASLAHLLDERLRRLVPVRQPLFLISQAQRSGGTLLLRLLDGHPECHVVPFQLRGFDEAAKLSFDEPEQAWQALYDPKLVERFHRGHRQRKHDVLRDEEVFPFRLQPELQRALYDACTAEVDEPATRDFFDCYFTSYFNAWVDYRNFRSGAKRWLVGFEPGIARSPSRRRAVRRLYPEGRVVSIVRDPWGWYASARRWEPRWNDRERAMNHWCRVGGSTLKWRRRNRGDVRVLTFEELLTETEQTMRKLAAWLELEFRPELLVPTFNGQPIGANTSFSDVATEVSKRPLERAQDELDADDFAYIELRAGELYALLLERAGQDWEA